MTINRFNATSVVGRDANIAADSLLTGREILGARVDKMAAMLRRSAFHWDDYADYFDLTGKPDLALDCRRLARECREAAL